MQIEQFVMAYEVDQDRLRAILPDGFSSLRPVLRINAEIHNCRFGYIEFNTAVEKDGIKGWLNIDFWDDVSFGRNEKTVKFKTKFLDLSFTAVGIMGSCPAEKDNGGCYFLKGDTIYLRNPETISSDKEFCDCKFRWSFSKKDACGKSMGKTIPAFFKEPIAVYPKKSFTVENATEILCKQVLGSYAVVFDR